MKYDQIFEKTNAAFSRGEVLDLLVGKNGYSLQDCTLQKDSSGLTDDAVVLRHGVYPYLRSLHGEDQQVAIEEVFTSFREMLRSGDPVYVWWALRLLFRVKRDEGSSGEAIPLQISDAMWSETRNALNANERKLRLCGSYAGGNYRQLGLMGDVLRIANILDTDHGVRLID